MEREGYAIVRGLLSEDEVAELHDDVGAIFERNPPGMRGNRGPEDMMIFPHAMLNRSPAAQRAVANPKLLTVIEPLTDVPPGRHLSGRPPPGARGLDDGLDYKGQDVVPLITRAGDAGLLVSDVWRRRMSAAEGDQGRFFL